MGSCTIPGSGAQAVTAWASGSGLSDTAALYYGTGALRNLKVNQRLWLRNSELHAFDWVSAGSYAKGHNPMLQLESASASTSIYFRKKKTRTKKAEDACEHSFPAPDCVRCIISDHSADPMRKHEVFFGFRSLKNVRC